MRIRWKHTFSFITAAALFGLTAPADASTGVDRPQADEDGVVLLLLDADEPADFDADPLSTALEGGRGGKGKGKGKGRKGRGKKRDRDGDADDGDGDGDAEDGKKKRKKRRKKRRKKKKDDDTDAGSSDTWR